MCVCVCVCASENVLVLKCQNKSIEFCVNKYFHVNIVQRLATQTHLCTVSMHKSAAKLQKNKKKTKNIIRNWVLIVYISICIRCQFQYIGHRHTQLRRDPWYSSFFFLIINRACKEKSICLQCVSFLFFIFEKVKKPHILKNDLKSNNET